MVKVGSHPLYGWVMIDGKWFQTGATHEVYQLQGFANPLTQHASTKSMITMDYDGLWVF
jgi:hypothetical protein